MKHPFVESQVVWKREQSHPAAYDPEARLALMDEAGIYAQVIYPNSIGLGGQNLSSSVDDQPLKLLCVQIYNDAMAELQDWSTNRFLPMPVMPAWSVDDCVRETERVAGLGLRGVNMTADPQDLGSPDLASRAWDPFWAVCADLNMPVHFHIGGSLTSAAFYGQYFWPSQSEYVKPGIGGSMHFINNARLVINTIWAGIFDRHPKLKMVSVESGIGWLPFIMETMDWELPENAPVQAKELAKAPSEYVKDHWYATTVVREKLRRPANPGRQDRRGQRPVRDRLPPSHLPLSRSAGLRGGEDVYPSARHEAQGNGRQRRRSLPFVRAWVSRARQPSRESDIPYRLDADDAVR